MIQNLWDDCLSVHHTIQYNQGKLRSSRLSYLSAYLDQRTQLKGLKCLICFFYLYILFLYTVSHQYLYRPPVFLRNWLGFWPFALPDSTLCLSYFQLQTIAIFFFLCLDSWESLSGPFAPKLYPTSSIPKHVRRVSMRITLLYLFSHGVCEHMYRQGVPEDRPSGASASACPMNHMPSFTLWRDPGYVAKL